MTDKLKCPFCGAELVGHEDAYGNISDIWFDCPNEECEHAWTTFRFDIWQALIDGKKAQDALKEIANYTYFIGETDMKWHVRHLMNIARKAITKQEE